MNCGASKKEAALGDVSSPLVLALETSCDESAAALIKGRDLLASEVFSQIEVHGQYGGVVPEVASRNHLRALRPVLETVLQKSGTPLSSLDAVAGTAGPGLATSLMLGLSLAKGIAVALRKPFLPVNHIEGHLLSPFLSVPEGPCASIGLVVSGGHTLLVRINSLDSYRLLGRTLDDAAGEAFDKVGKLLGLPYPGGPHLNQRANAGDPSRFSFPRSMIGSDDFHFSFSGLKTAVRYLLQKESLVRVEDVCASFQEAVVDVLVSKTMRALRQEKLQTLALSGGVSCNSRLRERFEDACARAGVRLLLAPPSLCTDNAAMIAYVGALRFSAGAASRLDAEIEPSLKASGWLQ